MHNKKDAKTGHSKYVDYKIAYLQMQVLYKYNMLYISYQLSI